MNSEISKAVEILKNNGLVGIPTETVYGLAANGLNPLAVLKIYEAKKRPSFDPLILHSSVDKIFTWVENVPDAAYRLAEKFWPGPLTLILDKADSVPYETTSGLNTVGIRVPNHPLTLELLAQLPFPVAAPSANPFGYISPTTAQHVVNQLGDVVDLVLDGGACSVGIESTIVGFENERAVIYRLGGLSVREIEDQIGEVDVKNHSASNPKAPGMTTVHYAPKKPLILVNNFGEVEDDEKTAYMLFDEKLSIPKERQFFLSEKGSAYEAAARLYALMRILDDSEFNRIIVKRLPAEGIGQSINDRLYRASLNRG